MNNSTLIPGAAEGDDVDHSADPGAAVPSSHCSTPGEQETPGVLPNVTALQVRGDDPPGSSGAPLVVEAKPVARLPVLPAAMGVSDRQRKALQALAGGWVRTPPRNWPGSAPSPSFAGASMIRDS
jgi:hypothetical protein